MGINRREGGGKIMQIGVMHIHLILLIDMAVVRSMEVKK